MNKVLIFMLLVFPCVLAYGKDVLSLNIDSIEHEEDITKLYYKVYNNSDRDIYLLSWSCSVYDGWSIEPKPVVFMSQKDFDSAVSYFCDKNVPFWLKISSGTETRGVLDVWIPKDFDQCNGISVTYSGNVAQRDLGVYGAMERMGKEIVLKSQKYYLDENCPNKRLWFQVKSAASNSSLI